MKQVNKKISDMTYTNPSDYIGLSTETKETENIVDGSTFWEVDTSTLFIFYNGQWYEQS